MTLMSRFHRMRWLLVLAWILTFALTLMEAAR
jgi:hypothetical protein